MPTATEQALITLAPTLHNLPSELVDLATSLLAQSRTKATNLKQEEEIGRTYACAHIACDRLKQRLGLEKLVPRPPVPPRVYKKLYGFLEEALKVPVTPKVAGGRYRDAETPQGSGRQSARGRPRTKDGDVKTPGSVEIQTPRTNRARDKQPKLDTPSKSSGKRAVPSKVTETPTSNKRRRVTSPGARKPSAQVPEDSFPPFVDKMLNHLCIAFSIPTTLPHLRSGLSAVLAIRGYEPTPLPSALTDATRPTARTPLVEIITTPRIPAVLIVLTLYAHSKLQGAEVSVTEWRIQRARGIQAVRQVDEGYAMSDEDLMRDIDVFMRAAKAEGWLEGEWYASLREAAGAEIGDVPEGQADDGESRGERIIADSDEEMRDEQSEEEEDSAAGPRRRRAKVAKTPLRREEKHGSRGDHDGNNDDLETAAGLRPGLGTMFQDAIDWLSEDRRVDYRNWERGVRTRLERMENMGAIQAEPVASIA